MIKINLLPHREEARRGRRQQFFVLGGIMLAAGLVIALAVHTFLVARVDAQQSSNDFLKGEIARLDKDIAEIKRLREQTQALLSRKQVIELLQSHRAETVYLFNELARQVPEGIYLKSVKQTGLKINLTGYAQSNARVSTLMRNLDASPVLEKPELVEIKAVDVNKRRLSEFNLNISIERADPDAEKKNESAKAVPSAASAPAENKSATGNAAAPAASTPAEKKS
ncbi:PilN domain-containing protein [Niveibacterium terrae]|uniref:PilN domain-containing protein n=1 Tax=Niveibacterium terrae TaxID=3373598 RepID=UPI003A934FEF